MVTLSCGPLEAEAQARDAQLRAAQAVLDRVRHGPRPEEIAVGEAVVGYSQARAEEAAKTYGRTRLLREGVSVTTAHLLETLRDARVSSAQLGEAQAKLELLLAGSREEDIREAESRRDTAEAQLKEARAQLDQCSVHAPVDGVVVDVLANPGEFMSLAVPAPLLQLAPNAKVQVRAEIDPRQFAASLPRTIRIGYCGRFSKQSNSFTGRIDKPGNQQPHAFHGGQRRSQSGRSETHSKSGEWRNRFAGRATCHRSL